MSLVRYDKARSEATEGRNGTINANAHNKIQQESVFIASEDMFTMVLYVKYVVLYTVIFFN